MIRLVLAFALLAFPAAAFARDARVDVEALLAADRAFSAAAQAAATPTDGLAAIFDAEVVMPVPGQGLIVGRDAVAAAWRANPSYAEGNVRWSPVRGGVSADGSQGFTYGFLTLSAGDPARRNRKYLAYWVRRPAGWRVVAYRQIVRAPGEVATAMLPPSLPGFSARPSTNARAVERHRAGLAAAEAAFSARAQQVGLRVAFRENGRADAMNMYGDGGFTIGVEAIAAGFPAEETVSPVRWGTERSFVASSGDLGVSIGTIVANRPAGGRPSSFPFFTIWRRDTPNAPWRYIAE